MLTIVIPAMECWNEATEEFVRSDEVILTLEHSLFSLSEWESKYKKPFLDSSKTSLEMFDYIRMMTVKPEQKPYLDTYARISSEQLQAISEYMEDTHTATWFREENRSSKKEVVTAEVIYYWMFSNQIPIECQYWHLNKLITLIRVFSAKNKPAKKMSKNDIYRQNSALNAARRKKLNSRG